MLEKNSRMSSFNENYIPWVHPWSRWTMTAPASLITRARVRVIPLLVALWRSFLEACASLRRAIEATTNPASFVTGQYRRLPLQPWFSLTTKYRRLFCISLSLLTLVRNSCSVCWLTRFFLRSFCARARVRNHHPTVVFIVDDRRAITRCDAEIIFSCRICNVFSSFSK